MELFSVLPQNLVAHIKPIIENNDPAHRWDHIEEVARNGCWMAEQLGLQKEPFLLAALIHDMFSGTMRKEHHALAADWCEAMLSYFLEDTPKQEWWRSIVRDMCYHHRASGRGCYPHIYAEAFAAADRGPLNIERSVQRSWQHHPDAQRVVNHLHEKFNPRGGYAVNNDIHARLYREENAQFYCDLANLTPARVLEIVGVSE